MTVSIYQFADYFHYYAKNEPTEIVSFIQRYPYLYYAYTGKSKLIWRTIVSGLTYLDIPYNQVRYFSCKSR